MIALSEVTLETFRAFATQQYNLLLAKAEKRLRERPVLDSNFSKESINRRILQRFNEITYEAFCAKKLTSFKCEKFAGSDDYDRFFDQIRISQKNGSIVLSYRRLAYEHLYAVGLFGFVLVRIVMGSVASWWTKSRGAAGLITDLGPHLNAGGSDARFVRFVREGPIVPLRNCTRLIAQAGKPIHSTSEFVSYARFPLFQLLSENKVSIGSAVALCADHFAQYFRFLFFAVLRSDYILLSRDYAFLSVMRFLNNRRLIEDIFLTDGNSFAQYLHTNDLKDKSFNVHFLWHSQNVRGVVLDDFKDTWEWPSRRYMKMDHAWYWTSQFKEWLEKNEIDTVGHAVGPIMFHLPEANRKSTDYISKSGKFSICVFDVTAISEEYTNTRGYGYLYYNERVCSEFLDGIIEAAQAAEKAIGIEVQIVLKHKRAFGWVHSRTYIEYVQTLKESRKLDVVDPDSNIFELVKCCDVVIALPFTSAAYVGPNMGVPAIFYDPTTRVCIPPDLLKSDIAVLKGKTDLKDFISELVLRHLNRSNQDLIPNK